MSRESCFAGMDVGTSFIKTAVIDGDGELLGSYIDRSGADLKGSIEGAYEGLLADAGLTREGIAHLTATGFGRGNVEFADSRRTEINCHARGAHHFFPGEITIIDIGGQDTKIIKVNADGSTKGFRMNRKCAAGTGAFLEEIALRLNIPLGDMNGLASRSTGDLVLNSYCTVFAKTEILTRIREGEAVEDMVKSAFVSVTRRVLEMDTLEGDIVMTGGVVEHNPIVREILESQVGREILTPARPQLTGAMGAALFARGA
jgi:predicted CoA-substrate-specific enzyme activase